MVVRIRWDLTGELPRLRENRAVVVVPALEEHLDVMGEILMRTWGGFIRSPEVTRRRVGPSLSAGIEQPFIAYLGDRPVGCVSPRLDLDSRIGVLDGGVHVLPEYRRQSIGSTLLKTALKWLKDRGMVAADHDGGTGKRLPEVGRDLSGNGVIGRKGGGYADTSWLEPLHAGHYFLVAQPESSVGAEQPKWGTITRDIAPRRVSQGT
ncbi:MAG: GNAT family N-acetyltransferase, partial [Candidatus Thorarchaeota archaeon]